MLLVSKFPKYDCEEILEEQFQLKRQKNSFKNPVAHFILKNLSNQDLESMPCMLGLLPQFDVARKQG